MKKSEMIQLIENRLRGSENLISYEARAGYVLRAIEEAGMLPPPVNGVVMAKELDDGRIVVQFTKWENEK